MPNSSIKNEDMYEDLRKQGNSKEKSARLSGYSGLTKDELVAALRDH